MTMESKIGESTIESVGSLSSLGFITSYKSNLRRLKIEVQNLETAKNGVQNSVDEAKRRGEVIVTVVRIWLKKVDATIAEAKKLIDNDLHAKDKSYMIYFLNLRFRNQLSKKSENMTQEILKLQAENIFTNVSYAREFKPSMLKEIQQALKDPNYSIIGLYGIDGVGKTTLVKELAREVEKDGSFDAVAMAEVTDSPDVENIQGQIAYALGLKFDKEAKEEKAERLRRRIRKEKSILVILDDIWGKVDLAELGIPFGDDHKGCKLLLTSEQRNVLKRQMGTQKDFKLEVLSDEESWRLFEKIAGNEDKESSIEVIAEDVAKCCRGLPLLLVVVAKALKGKDVSVWDDALKQLKGLDELGFLNEVICPLELCYDLLETYELQSLFLFIVSFGPGRIHTGDLFSCYWGLYGDSHTLTEARKKYYKLIDDLRASSLLLEDEIEYVRMHDVVRDMAKAIASRSHLTYEVRNFTQMEQWDLEQLQRCYYINLPSYKINVLPDKLDCPKLKVMSLRRNHGYLTIPDNFFSGMREVKVLNLHGIRFAPFPPNSLGLLKNLVSLNLYGCALKDIKIVAELTRLEILTLERAEIRQLPQEIGKLVYLRMLNLTNCYQLKTIPENLLSRLTRLEELYMGNCDIPWEVKGGKGRASMGELSHLYQLTALDISIRDASVLPADMDVFANLERYNICIGNMWKWSSLWCGDARETSRTLKLTHSLKTNIEQNPGVQLFFPSVENLILSSNSVDLNGNSFPKLRHLDIENSDAFFNLETLILCNLHIIHGSLPTHSFEKLQVVKVQRCDKLKKLFLYSPTKNLPQLQEMEISECKIMEEIIYDEEDEKEVPMIILPKLHSLTLDTLSMLHSFSLSVTADKDDQSIPMPLLNEKVTFPELETLTIRYMNSWKLIWGNQQAPNSFCKLNKVEITGCDALHHVFPIAMLKELQQLQVLEISTSNIENIVEENSHDVEQVLSSNNDGDAPGEIVFSELKKLTLKILPWLTNFCKESYNLNFPSLETVHVIGCPNMKTFVQGNLNPIVQREWRDEKGQEDNEFNNQSVSFALFNKRVYDLLYFKIYYAASMLNTILKSSLKKRNGGFDKIKRVVDKVAMPKLQMLELAMINSLKIWDDEVPLQNLRILIVRCCHRLVRLFSSSKARALVQLQHLEISACDELVEIFVEQKKVTFRNLKKLFIRGMNSLKSIWNNQHAQESFCNLNKIQITGCDALNHVFPVDVAKELRQLQVLEISASNNIENIVEKRHSCDAQHDAPHGNESDALNEISPSKELKPEIGNEGDAQGELVFMKLEELNLKELPRLTSFCKESYNFEFPALQTVRVIRCPNIKTFCNGNLVTPKLLKVQYGYEERELDCWDADLNTTPERIAKGI